MRSHTLTVHHSHALAMHACAHTHYACMRAGAVLLGGYVLGNALGYEEAITPATYLVSSALCISAIACLSKQSSSRTGNALGMIGVSGGITAALGSMHAAIPVYGQVRGPGLVCGSNWMEWPEPKYTARCVIFRWSGQPGPGVGGMHCMTQGVLSGSCRHCRNGRRFAL